MKPVSRAYHKIRYAIEKNNIHLQNKVCADFGSSTGGFVQAILEENPKTIYSIETSKNRLHFVLKDDARVIRMDQTNALHVTLPEKIDFISIDVGWTPQEKVLPNAIKNLKKGGEIVSLIKPHYELQKQLPTIEEVKEYYKELQNTFKKKLIFKTILESPLEGKKGKNKEYLLYAIKR